MAREKRASTFAGTFPTGTHAMWMHYWLAAAGINPSRRPSSSPCRRRRWWPTMRVGNMDGFLCGRTLEPLRHHGRHRHDRQHHAGHLEGPPEKVLGTTAEFVQKHPNTTRAVMMAVLEASRWIDASLSNKSKMAETVAQKAYINTSVDAINQRILGRYQNGMARPGTTRNHMKFFNDGAVNFPVPERWHVVPHPTQALGPAQEPPGLSWWLGR